MPHKTSVLVAVTSAGKDLDLMAQGLCEVIRCRGDQMLLVGEGVLQPHEVDAQLAEIDPSLPCALVLVGQIQATRSAANRWLEKYPHLVVARVPIGDDLVLIEKRDPRLEQVVDAIQDLVETAGRLPSERSLQLQLPAPANEDQPEPDPVDDKAETIDGDDEEILELDADDRLDDGEPPALPPPQPLLEAAIDWAHVRLKKAVGRLFGENGRTIEFTRVQVIDWLDERGPRSQWIDGDKDVAAADQKLSEALHDSRRQPGGSGEPLAKALEALGLDPLEFRLLVLVLAPELDPRYQHWISLQMMDDPSRLVGTLAFYADLLGVPSEIAVKIFRSGGLAHWRLIEGGADTLPAVDAPLRLDPSFRAWLLGGTAGLEDTDRALRHILEPDSWPGVALIDDEQRAQRLVAGLGTESWLVLAGNVGPAVWRALLETGAAVCGQVPIRVDLSAAASLSPVDSAEAGVRLARLARLSGRPLLFDAARIEPGPAQDAAVAALLRSVGNGPGAGAIVAPDVARIVRLLGNQDYRVEREEPSESERFEVLARAAEKTGAHFSTEAAELLANLYPLPLDALAQAMKLANARPLAADSEATRRARFIAACKDIAAEGGSGLAQRIEPIFDLDDLVLPPDRKSQLEEIVDNIRFAPKVLEGWRFREQLPYGLGVTALFHGPSGVGKTMGAMAVARRIGVHILRLDLSRVVSKYIGDTEKHIDQIFQEAQRSGAALLIDEADALMSRRSNVNDAHDRYANLEVAYLLQRMEAHEGLVMLTTNMRQNLDSAFLRRLRFIVDFPKPDAAAREEIWRRCLPPESHEIDDVTFRQLARRIELTGGSIRQITLRAAFIAAAAGQRIGPSHIAHAVRAEFAKLGVPPVELDLAEARRAA